MAERITELSPRRGGRPPLYPWDEWMDGHAWRITRPADFETPAKSMATTLYVHAARKGVSVSVRILGDDAVEFQFSQAVAA